jgi:hypothetical protein
VGWLMQAARGLSGSDWLRTISSAGVKIVDAYHLDLTQFEPRSSLRAGYRRFCRGDDIPSALDADWHRRAMNGSFGEVVDVLGH